MSICLLLILCILFFQCPFGDPETSLEIFNYRNTDISVHYKKEFFERLNIPEKKLDIKKGETSGIGDSGIANPLSIAFEHIIVKDSNGTEIMNLRGSSLNETVKLEYEDEHRIEYRLDICDTPSGLCKE